MVLDIFIQIILPIFILIGVGVGVDRLMKVDLPTLSKLLFYLFLPAIIFVNLVESELTPHNFTAVVGFSAVHFVLLLGLSLIVFNIPGLRQQRSLLLMGALFTNAGNYGLPLAHMAFGKSGVTSMALIQVTQSIAIFTLGLWLVDRHHRNWKDMLRGFLSVPLIYAIGGALLINSAGIQIPEVLWSPVRYLGGALVPVALMTLGVQLSRSRISVKFLLPITAASVMRLLISPLLAVGLASAWTLVWPGGLDGVYGVLIIAMALPIAVNVSILSIEYNREPEMVSQMVFLSTVLSALTMTVWLFFFGN
jgi:malate permease and related proteins